MGKKLFIALIFSVFFLASAGISLAAMTVTINSPINNSNATGPIAVRFNASSSNTTRFNYTLWVDGVADRTVEVANATAMTSAMLNFTYNATGLHRFQIEVWNVADPAVNSTLITVDTGPYIFSINGGPANVTYHIANNNTLIVNNTNLSDATPQINFTIKDDTRNNATFQYAIWIDGAMNFTSSITNNTVVAYNLTSLTAAGTGSSGLTNGTRRIQIELRNSTVSDGKAFFNTTLYTIFIDNGVPTISLASPANNTNISDATPEIQFNITDGQATALTYRVWVNNTLEAVGVTSATNSTIIFFNLSGRVNGTSVVVVEANDSAGNIVNSTPLHVIVDTTKPTLTLSVSTSTVEPGKSVTISCSASDDTSTINTTSVVVTKPGSSTETSGCGSSFSNTLSTGTYTVTFTATDIAGNTDSKSVTFSTSSAGDGGSSGGGGGGGGGASTPPAKKSTNAFTEMNVGVVHKVKISEPEIGLKQIEIEVNNKALSVEITITKLDGQPASVTQTVSGNIFQYVQIDHKNLDDSNIKSAKIRFNVTKAWITANGVDPATVALNRYNVTWQKLATSKVRESGTEIEYEADTPGFSVFAVTGTAAAQAPTTTVPSPPSSVPVTTSLPGATTTTLPAAGGDTTIWIFIVFVAVVLALFYFLFMKKKK